MKLVMLPGMDGTGELFHAFANALDNRFETLIVEYPTDQLLSYAELEGVVTPRLPQHEPYTLIGESFSGPIAISIAAKRPRNLHAFILCSTFCRNPRPELGFLSKFVTAIPIQSLPISIIGRFLLGRHTTSERISSLKAVLRRVDAKVLRQRLQLILTVDVSDKLRSVRIPSIYFRGTEDLLIPKGAVALIHKNLPSLSVVCFEAPHFLLQTVPIEASSALVEFLDKTENAL